MTAFGTCRVTLNGTALKGTAVGGISKRPTERKPANGGDLHVTQISRVREAPMGRFTSGDIGALLNLINNTQLPMKALDSGGLLLDFPQGAADAPGWLSGNTSLRCALATGSAYLSRLSWSPGQPCAAEVMVYGTSADGTTSPYAESNVAAPGQLGAGIDWVVTNLTVGGIQVPRLASVDITVAHNAENNADPCYDFGLPQPKRVAHPGATGPAEITATVVTHEMNLALSGGAVLVVTLQPKSLGGPGFAAGTVVISINGEYLDDTDREGGTPATRTLKISAAHDGTNLPWARSIS